MATKPRRADRQGAHRIAFEKNRKTILASQEICAICGKPVDKTLKSPHPLSATVDHIIPIDLGGHPSDLNNLQLAHRCCNREKSNKLQAPAQVAQSMVIANDNLPLSCDWTTYRAG